MSPNDRLSPACLRLCSQNTQGEARERERDRGKKKERAAEAMRQERHGVDRPTNKE